MKLKILFTLTIIPLLILAMMYVGFKSPEAFMKENQPEKTFGKRHYAFLMKESESFQYPGSMIGPWQEFGGNLYVHDQVDQVTYKLSSMGSFLDTLGRKGSAPWQNQQVCQMHVTHAGLYYLDNGLMTAKELSHSGVPILYKKHDELFWDGFHLEDQRYLMLNDESMSFGFYLWNSKNGNKGALMRLDSLYETDINDNLHIAFEGEMVQGNSFHYYVCSRAGLFFSFKSNGTFHAKAETLDQTKPPEVVERTYNNLTMFERQPDEIVNYAATSDGKNLLVLSTIAFEETDKLSIDKYDPEGRYLGSMLVPNHRDNFPVSIITGSEGRIWVLYEDLYIIRYDLIRIPA
jgi:hypothetical protein